MTATVAPARSSPGTVRHGDARVAACLGAASAASSPRRLQPGSGIRRAGRICRWLEQIVSAVPTRAAVRDDVASDRVLATD
jgi:hypothetical protein